VVVPLAQRPDPRLSLFAAPRIAQVLGQQDVEFIAVHVGDLAERPDVALPEPSELGRWTWEQRSGSVSDGIVAVATEREADLIAMVTEGARGVAEVFGGSTTSQVLRHAPCSLLATPARMFEGGDAAAPPPA
jgi:nucleotide-binding universal stress UspA family protein